MLGTEGRERVRVQERHRKLRRLCTARRRLPRRCSSVRFPHCTHVSLSPFAAHLHSPSLSTCATARLSLSLLSLRARSSPPLSRLPPPPQTTCSMLPLISPLLRPLFPSRPLRARVWGVDVALRCFVECRLGNFLLRLCEQPRQMDDAVACSASLVRAAMRACHTSASATAHAASSGQEPSSHALRRRHRCRADARCCRWSHAAHGPLSAAASSSCSLLFPLVKFVNLARLEVDS
ncbi:hypothetical protein FA09DRAFT_143632 [Tilletiopsis washingtonensis]|uniref:Uncharacterized protein n=1 Tax=Tilletiopsis washingtonensis TaxID=58919 RepID=A0A316Z1W3_9BASI|nr:hypothetical protein FA09DRAFT_143632 [Tilletiopsis washingtonensis]PWN95521.1 hypothetical protein FA09DRAFT_143632 [Tilletiopsis washingtonensis]